MVLHVLIRLTVPHGKQLICELGKLFWMKILRICIGPFPKLVVTEMTVIVTAVTDWVTEITDVVTEMTALLQLMLKGQNGILF